MKSCKSISFSPAKAPTNHGNKYNKTSIRILELIVFPRTRPARKRTEGKPSRKGKGEILLTRTVAVDWRHGANARPAGHV